MQTSGIAPEIVLVSLCLALYSNDLPSQLKHCTVKFHTGDLKVNIRFAPGL